MRRTWLSVFALGLAFGASAGLRATAPPSDVLNAANSYIRAVAPYAGAEPDKLDPSLVVCINPGDPIDLDTEYLVLWDGDMNASGGNHAARTYVAIVKRGVANLHYVDSTVSSPQVDIHVPSAGMVTRIVSHTATSLVLEGPEYSNSDSLCCPSLRVRYTVKKDLKGNWVLQGKQKVVGKNPTVGG